MKKEEAMEIVKKLYNNSLFLKKDKEALETLIPELAESEDEKIRKEMIEVLGKEAKEFPSSVIASKASSWISWLEKQCEQKPTERSYLTKNETAEKLIALAECLEMDGDCLFNGLSGDDYGKLLRVLAIELTEVKTTWSEEDSEWYMIVKESILERWRGTDNKDLIELRDGALEWLKSIKGRIQPKPKQGEQESLCDKCKKEHPSHFCQDITELGRCAIEHEQKDPIGNIPKLEKIEKTYDPTIPFLYTDLCTSKTYVEMDGYRINVIDLFNKLPKEK